MQFTGFIMQALPWVKTMLFPKGIANDLLQRLQKLAFSISGEQDFSAYIKILSNAELLTQYQLQAQRIRNDYVKYNNLDRINARRRDLEVRKTHRGNRRAEIMIYVAIVGLFTSVVCLWFFSSYMPSNVASTIVTIISVFLSCLRDMYTFEFGQTPDQKFAQLPELR